jgi:hypothetical protein
MKLKRNFNMQTVSVPRLITENKNYVYSVRTLGDLLLSTDLSGTFTAYDSRNQLTISSYNVLPDISDTDNEVLSPPWIANATSCASGSSIIACVCFIINGTPSNEGESRPTSAKKKGKEAEPKVKRRLCQIMVLEVESENVLVKALDKPTIGEPISVVDILHIDMEPDDYESSISIDVSGEHRSICVVSSGGCSLFPLISAAARRSEVPTIPEEREDVDTGKAFPTIKSSLPIITLPRDSFFNCKVLRAIRFISTTPPQILKSMKNGSQSNTTSVSEQSDGADAAPHSKQPHKSGDYELMVLFSESREWQVVDIHTPAKQSKMEGDADGAGGLGSRKASSVSTGKAKKGKGADKAKSAVGAPAPKDVQEAPHATVLSSWRLAARVTADFVEGSRVVLALGLADGTVSLWDLRARILIRVVCMHQAPVTAVCIIPRGFFGRKANGIKGGAAADEMGANAHLCRVVSGSADGTVCLYSPESPYAKNEDILQNNESVLVGADAAVLAKSMCGESLLHRNDVPNVPVERISLLPDFPTVVVEHAIRVANDAVGGAAAVGTATRASVSSPRSVSSESIVNTHEGEFNASVLESTSTVKVEATGGTSAVEGWGSTVLYDSDTGHLLGQIRLTERLRAGQEAGCSMGASAGQVIRSALQCEDSNSHAVQGMMYKAYIPVPKLTEATETENVESADTGSVTLETTLILHDQNRHELMAKKLSYCSPAGYTCVHIRGIHGPHELNICSTEGADSATADVFLSYSATNTTTEMLRKFYPGIRKVFFEGDDIGKCFALLTRQERTSGVISAERLRELHEVLGHVDREEAWGQQRTKGSSTRRTESSKPASRRASNNNSSARLAQSGFTSRTASSNVLSESILTGRTTANNTGKPNTNTDPLQTRRGSTRSITTSKSAMGTQAGTASQPRARMAATEDLSSIKLPSIKQRALDPSFLARTAMEKNAKTVEHRAISAASGKNWKGKAGTAGTAPADAKDTDARILRKVLSLSQRFDDQES